MRNHGLVLIFVRYCKNRARVVDVTNLSYDSLIRNRINNLQFTEKLFTRKSHSSYKSGAREVLTLQ